MDTTITAPTDLPEGAAFLPINCVFARRTVFGANRPLLALIDAKLFEELSPFNWRTSEAAGQPLTGHLFRVVVDDRLVTADNKRSAMREGLGARVRGVHKIADDRVLYRNGDRLDCRMCNVVPWAEHVTQGVDPTLKVAPGSSFNRLDCYQWALRERHTNAVQLAARFPLGPRPKLTPEQVLELLKMVRDEHIFKGRSYGFFRQAIEENYGVKLTVPSIRAILRGKQQKIEGFDYAPVIKWLPDRSAKRIERLNALSEPRPWGIAR